MFISFSNGHGSTFENSLDSGCSFASVPIERQRCWKRGSGDGQRLWDYFTARLSDLQFNAVDKRGSTLTWTVCKAIGGSRKRGAANLYDVLIRGERWIVLMLSPTVRDVQRQRCCKRGSGDGQRLSLDYDTTERSFNAVERRGSTLTWTVCKAIGGSR